MLPTSPCSVLLHNPHDVLDVVEVVPRVTGSDAAQLGGRNVRHKVKRKRRYRAQIVAQHRFRVFFVLEHVPGLGVTEPAAGGRHQHRIVHVHRCQLLKHDLIVQMVQMFRDLQGTGKRIRQQFREFGA